MRLAYEIITEWHSLINNRGLKTQLDINQHTHLVLCHVTHNFTQGVQKYRLVFRLQDHQVHVNLSKGIR